MPKTGSNTRRPTCGPRFKLDQGLGISYNTAMMKKILDIKWTLLSLKNVLLLGIIVPVLFFLSCSGAKEKPKQDSSVLLSRAIQFEEQGQYDKAIGLYEQAMALRIKNRGAKDPGQIAIYTSMGDIYREMKKSEKAMECYNKAIKTAIAIGRKDHPETFSSYIQLATYHNGRAEYKKAIEFYKNALPTVTIFSAEQKRDSAAAGIRQKLGNCWQALGKYENAIKYYKTTLEYCEKYLGKDNKSTQAIRGKIEQLEKLIEKNR